MTLLDTFNLMVLLVKFNLHVLLVNFKASLYCRLLVYLNSGQRLMNISRNTSRNTSSNTSPDAVTSPSQGTSAQKSTHVLQIQHKCSSQCPGTVPL